MDMPSTRNEFSAGGVVYRRDDAGQVEVALIGTHAGERWGLPKGWVEKDESPQEAALREVREETGIRARIVQELERIEYWFRWNQGAGPLRIHKHVDFFLMQALSGDTAEHDHEVEEVGWFSLDEALERATYKGERQVLEKARRLLTPGSSSNAPLENE